MRSHVGTWARPYVGTSVRRYVGTWMVRWIATESREHSRRWTSGLKTSQPGVSTHYLPADHQVKGMASLPPTWRRMPMSQDMLVH